MLVTELKPKEEILAQLVTFAGALGHGFESALVLGMEPGRIEPGIGLSEPCRGALPELVRAVRDEIRQLRASNKMPREPRYA